MKIALLVGGFPAPSETFITNHVLGLLKAGHQVRVYARRHDSSVVGSWPTPEYPLRPLVRRGSISRGQSAPVRVLLGFVLSVWTVLLHPIRSAHVVRSIIRHTSHILPRNPVTAWLRVMPFITNWKPDVFHCHFGNNGLLGAQLKEAGAIQAPLVVTFHGHDVHSVPRHRGMDVYQNLFPLTTLATANTRFTAAKVVELGCEPGRIRLVPMGFFFEDFKLKRLERDAPRVGLKLISVARLVEKKGLTYAIAAVRMIADTGIDVAYDIIGDGPLREELQEQVDAAGLSDVVRFLGRLPNTEVQMNLEDADLFVLPSVTAKNGDMEGQALVLQEAQAKGLPVVSTFHNGIPDGVQDGITGILVKERDSEGLARAFEQLYRDKETYMSMSQAGPPFVADRYDQTVLTERWLGVYNEACGLQPT